VAPTAASTIPSCGDPRNEAIETERGTTSSADGPIVKAYLPRMLETGMRRLSSWLAGAA
jgi:hypothetical protein